MKIFEEVFMNTIHFHELQFLVQNFLLYAFYEVESNISINLVSFISAEY